MLVYIVGTIALFRVLGLPVVPVLLAGGFVMAALAYRTSHSGEAIRCFVGLAVACTGRYLGAYVLAHRPSVEHTWIGHVAVALQPDWVFGTLSTVLIMYCVVIGVYGLPTEETAGTPLDKILAKRRNHREP
ncbi:hypothetical protein KDW82_08355 [Burkholderia vietnamiensis]|uniref:hypothetical protein n=1 Tax=Burkholderia vietnamiensis TaxID=60552 RepID=UPI001B9D39BE|nr:hypothetical protein [Burkholderia vietnamiensis]MBR8189069.1 hypothetical protein [Burkholderia vietnamiensis]